MSIPEVPYPMNQQADPLEELKKKVIAAERSHGTEIWMEDLEGLSEEELQRRLRTAMMQGTIYDNIPGSAGNIKDMRMMMMVYAGPQQMQKMAENGGGFYGFQPPEESEKPAGYCSECGIPLKRRSRFCPECGARLNWA